MNVYTVIMEKKQLVCSDHIGSRLVIYSAQMRYI